MVYLLQRQTGSEWQLLLATLSTFSIWRIYTLYGHKYVDMFSFAAVFHWGNLKLQHTIILKDEIYF